ncbi:hypothetical protein H6P81_003859 [Aristolochia fimbriata]|uniref:Protein ZIP4 homolog n=1 Tax=Aristolochia fimbriata TaxID=158543 RepID=A0AAV7FEV0_ARIFI|nr:hypothetical protein H6P81_003859 [Aristolochia fimbriata]
MRISEISPELQPTSPDSLSLLLGELEASIKEMESLPSCDLLQVKISSRIQKILPPLNAFLPLPESRKLQIWKLSYRLWNGCVDHYNAFDVRSDGDDKNKTTLLYFKEEQAKLRQMAADLLYLAANVSGISSPAFKTASFYHRAGLIWHEIKRFNEAANCFERATDLIAKVDMQRISDREEQNLLSDLNISRAKTAWEMSERNLALILLSRCKNLLFGISESSKMLAEQYLQFGKLVISKEGQSAVGEALKLFNEALDVCDKGLKGTKRPEEAIALKNIREKALEFVAAAHLLGEEFDNVLKCVRLLRETHKSSKHPSVAFMAMKAYLGQARHGEAEKELKSMVINKEIPEALCASAVETFFKEVGSADAEVANTVFIGLLQRGHITAGAVLRVTQAVASESGDFSRSRTKVVAELVSDERTLALFSGDGEAIAEKRVAMHAVLWNRGAEHFKRKEYDVSAEMFEKSMLYVDQGNRVLRSKAFRVLCLCHLACSHLDRAEEYINEAEKLNPNISSAFLKFKILLQKNEQDRANHQIQAMVHCVDFKPEFLTLSAHEAMASRALPLAIASLVILLNLCSSGKEMPLTEVTILRHIIALLLRSDDPDESDILKYTKRARDRSMEIGHYQFFGEGAVGKSEFNWFARHSWNMGLKTWKEGKFDICSDFWELASEFYDAPSDGGEEHRWDVCKALILCASAMINSKKQEKSDLTDSEAKKALQMVDRAGKILLSSPSSGVCALDEKCGIEADLLSLHTMSAYYLKKRVSGGCQKQLIKNFASSKACTLQHLLSLGAHVSEGPQADLEDAEFTYQTCLSALLTDSIPDYGTVSFVIRKLVILTGLRHGEVGDEVYAVYREAYRIMVGLRETEYPLEEGKWLATTAWNRSVLPGRLKQVEAARRWMEMGLQLARQVPGLEAYASRMEKCLSALQNDNPSS